MWILSLEWLLLAVLVFWVVGAYKRLKRMRQQAKQAFTGVDAQFVQLLALLREVAAGEQASETPENATAPAHAQRALAPTADLLENALAQARMHPLRPEVIARLDSVWQSLQVAWHAYAQLAQAPTSTASAGDESTAQRWMQLHTLQEHSLEQFNAAVRTYNQAITAFPSCAIARISGHRHGRVFQKDAALLVQQQA
ncbi:MAG: hypothetical protein ACI4QS_07455 [Comamonas sp.]